MNKKNTRSARQPMAGRTMAALIGASLLGRGCDGQSSARLAYSGNDVQAARDCLNRGFSWFRIEGDSVACFRHHEPDSLDADMTIAERDAR